MSGYDASLPPDPCLCEIDADGRCPACARAFSDRARAMAKVIREYMERLPTELDAAGLVRCDACKDRELDRAVALTMRELAPHIPPSVREVLFASMIRGMEADGIEAHPLSDRELERATGRELA